MDNIIIRDKMMGLVNVVMRVPPLFIIDELLRIGMGIPEDNITLNNTDDNNFQMATGKNSILGTIAGVAPESLYFLHTYVTTTIIMKFIACCFGKYEINKK